MVLIVALLMAALVASAGPAQSASKAKTKPKTKTTVSKADAAKAAAAAKKKAEARLVSLKQSRAQRATVLRKKAEAVKKVSALKASNRKVSQSLDSLTSSLRRQNAALSAARTSVANAEAELADAKASEIRTRRELESLGSKRLQAALDAYTSPLSSDLSRYLDADSLSAASVQQTYIDVASRSRADVVDRLRALKEDLTTERKRAERAEKLAIQRRAAAADRLSDLAETKDQTERFASQVEDRLERALSESAALAGLDASLSKRIAAQQGEIAKQLATARRNGAKISGGRALNLPTVSTGSTNGIVVASSIRGKLAALLEGAQRDGINFSGGGYRSSAGQVALRIAHCGGSSYAIYSAPSSSCRPPTARPGRSMHERGLAVDFTANGRTLTRGTAGYQWLRANAGRYGFYNLPSEPWHWSTNGN